jgi:hypothetical protein
MTPDTLLKAGLGCLGVGLLLAAFAGRAEPPPATRAPVKAAPIATPEPTPEVVEASEPLPVPTPQVDPADRVRLQAFREAVFEAAATSTGPELQAMAVEVGASVLADELESPTEGRATPLERNRVLYGLLAHIGTDEARAILLADALKPGLEPTTLGPAAAEAWISGAASADEVLPLLESKEPAVQRATLLALAGRELTPAALQRLDRQLNNGDFELRTLAAKVLAADPSPANADARMKALAVAATRVGGIVGAAEVHPESGMTWGDMALGAFFNAAVTMQGSAQAAAAARGARLDLVTLVLASHGDPEVGEDVRNLARRSKGYLRFLALEAAAPSLTLDDATLLITLSGDAWELAPAHPAGRESRFPTSELAGELLMGLQ